MCQDTRKRTLDGHWNALVPFHVRMTIEMHRFLTNDGHLEIPWPTPPPNSLEERRSAKGALALLGRWVRQSQQAAHGRLGLRRGPPRFALSHPAGGFGLNTGPGSPPSEKPLPPFTLVASSTFPCRGSIGHNRLAPPALSWGSAHHRSDGGNGGGEGPGATKGRR